MKYLKKKLKKIGKNKIVAFILALIAYAYIKFSYFTTKWDVIDKKKLPKKDNFVGICWHNRILYIGEIWPYKNKCNFMVSPSRDGGFLSKYYSISGHKAISSSSSGSGTGSHALRAAIKILKKGENFNFAPDGSRGPMYKMKPGISSMIKLAKVGIYMAAYSVKRKKILNSWDQMIMPLPFNRGVIIYDYIAYDDLKNLDKGGLINFLENKLTKLTIRADKKIGNKPVLPVE